MQFVENSLRMDSIPWKFMMVAANIHIWFWAWQGLTEIKRFLVLETKCLLHLKPHQLLPKEDSKHQFLRTVFDIKKISLSDFSKLNFHFLLIGDSCQYWMDVETQTLTSPYYPQNYFPDGYSCEWYITAPEGNIISLEFDHFNVSNIKMQKTIFI